MKRILLAIILILMAGHAWGATYCVSGNGASTKVNSTVANSAACTAAAIGGGTGAMSRTTFNASTFTAGDTVYFSGAGGVMGFLQFPSSGSSVSVITTYQGINDGPGYPVVQAANASLNVAALSYIKIDGFIVNYQGTTAAANLFGSSGTQTDVQYSNITLNGGGYGYGLSMSGSVSNVTISNITTTGLARSPIYLYGASNGNVSISSSVLAGSMPISINNVAGLTLSALTKTGSSGTQDDFYINACSGLLVASGLSSAASTRYGINVNGCAFNGVATSILQSSTIANNTASYAALYVNNSTGFKIYNNQITNNKTTGILIAGTSHDIDIYNNTITGNGGGTWVTGGYNYNFYYNNVSNNLGDGMGTFLNATPGIYDVVYKYNTVSGNGAKTSTTEGDGITAHYNDYNITIAHNIIKNNTCSGVALVGKSTGWVYNNVIENNAGNWSLEGGGKLDQVRGGIFIEGQDVNPTTSTSWVVKNNISSGNYPREILLGTNGKNIVTMNYNLYNPSNASKFASLDNGSTDITWAQYHTSPNTYETNSINANPLFLSTTDYRLQASSPAIDKGVDVGLTSDIRGRTVPQNGKPDIGAYESQQSVSRIGGKFGTIYSP